MILTSLSVSLGFPGFMPEFDICVCVIRVARIQQRPSDINSKVDTGGRWPDTDNIQ